MQAHSVNHKVLSGEEESTCTAATSETDMFKVIESLDEEMKTTFTEAWKNHRDLVRRETPFFRFVEADKGNLDLAAKRLVGYWENRKSLFGERVFYPMVLDKEQERGALTYEDIEILETGFNTFLPDREDGSPPLFYDLSRLEKEMKGGKGKHRCNFCLLHIASEDEKSRSVGITMVRYTFGTSFHLDLQPFMAFLCTMPIIMKSIERVIYYPPGLKRIVQETIVPIRKRSMPEAFKKLLHMHTSDNIQEIARSLTKVGFSLSSLPDCLGGTTKYEELIRFDLTSKASVAKKPEEKNRLAEASVKSSASKHSRKRPLPGTTSIAEKSRKQRTKEKKNLEALMKEVADLQSENQSLKQEVTSLEGLVKGAKAEVTKFLQPKASSTDLIDSARLQRPVSSSTQVLPSLDAFMPQVTAASHKKATPMLHQLLRSPSQGRTPLQHLGVGGAQSGQAFTSHFHSPGFNAEAVLRNGLMPTIPNQAPFLASSTAQSTNPHNFQDTEQIGLPTADSLDPLSRMARAGSIAAPLGQGPANIDQAVIALLAEMQRRNGSL
eukprot:scaffold24070_cov92-Amphora_coffeaeformis.AAC.4